MDLNGPRTRSRNKRAQTRADNDQWDGNESNQQETLTFASSKRTRQVRLVI
jgi:hypothetical protein